MAEQVTNILYIPKDPFVCPKNPIVTDKQIQSAIFRPIKPSLKEIGRKVSSGFLRDISKEPGCFIKFSWEIALYFG